MMNTLLFKIGSMAFLGSSTVAAFVFSGLCPNGKADGSACATKGKVVAASTLEATAEPAALNEHCAKTKAAMAGKQECSKSKAAMANKQECSKSKAVAAKASSDCPYSKAATEMAQASD